MRQRHGRNRARAVLPSFGVRRVIAADICRRLARAGAQAADEPCEFEQRLIDVILPLDQHAMTQCRLAMLADAFADQFFSRHVVGCSRLLTATARSAARSIVNRVVFGLLIPKTRWQMIAGRWS